jgi:hypothetical protein
MVYDPSQDQLEQQNTIALTAPGRNMEWACSGSETYRKEMDSMYRVAGGKNGSCRIVGGECLVKRDGRITPKCNITWEYGDSRLLLIQYVMFHILDSTVFVR